MSGTLNKGSLIKGTGGSGGGGSASFPTIVTDSGSSLPSASGYQEGDTFLNTSDKKIYKTSADGYGINSVFDYTISNNLLEPTTGILDFSGGQKSLSINSYTEASYSLICPFIATDTEDIQYVVQGYKSNSTTNRYNVAISGGFLYFNLQELCEIEANKPYIIEIVVTGSQYASNRSGTIKVYTEEGTKIAEQTFTYSDTSIVVHFGSFIKAGPEGSFFTGKILRNVGEYNFELGSNDIVVVDTSSLNWDNGVALQNDTEYADKTNGILYLYQDTELIQIPLIDLSNYKLKATTTTIDTAIVTVSEIKANTNYVFSNNAITDITLSGCETSFEETTIEFTTGSTAPSVTDNSGITWMDNFDITNLSANKSYLIVIFNKLGFIKEY